MKNKLKKVLNSKTAPYIILFLVMLMFNIFKSVSVNDDAWFSQIITGKLTNEVNNMSEYISWRYNTWSSRLIIEFFLIEFTMRFGILWKVLDAVIFVIIAYSINRVFGNKDENSYIRWIIVFFVVFIPQELLASAGWIATTLNYTWVIAFGLFSLIPIRKCLDNEKIRWYEFIGYIFSMLYATNSEQMCLVLFTIYLIYTIYLISKKKINPFIIVLFIISICSLIYIMTCPGNTARTASEIENYYKDFSMLTIVQKLEMSVVSTMQYYIYNFNIIYVSLTSILMLKVIKKYSENMLFKLIAIIPFIFGIAFNVLSSVTEAIFPNIYKLMMETNQISCWFVNIEKFNLIEYYVPLVISILNLGLLIITVYLVFGNSKKSIVALLTICAGICTRILMGFMASVYVSGNRTQIIFLISMIIVIILALLDEKKENQVKTINVLLPFIIFTMFNNLYLSVKIR